MRRWIPRVIGWIGSHEAATLIGILVPVAGSWVFIVLADRVVLGRTQHIDDRILVALRQPGDPTKLVGPSWLGESARDVSALGGETVLTLVTSVVTGFLLLDRKYRAASFVLVATVGGTFFGAALKGIFDRPRPTVVPHLMPAYQSSFPSGHSLMSAVVYLTLGILLVPLMSRQRLRFYVLLIAVVLTGLVGVSRVLLGVHFPTDVLGGWSAGIVWACLCWWVERLLQRGGAVERPAPDPYVEEESGSSPGRTLIPSQSTTPNPQTSAPSPTAGPQP
jgi:undecaprenyl-diphosphatase